MGVFTPKKFMKKLISMVLFITILSTLFSLNVYATSQATNYQAFLKEHKNGTIYTPKEYSKSIRSKFER